LGVSLGEYIGCIIIQFEPLYWPELIYASTRTVKTKVIHMMK